MFANCQKGGKDSCNPDVCKTPPQGAPIAYPNVAMGCSAVGAVPKAIFGGAPAHNLSTTIPMSSGDETGAMGGATSQVIKGPARHTNGSTKAILAGVPASRQGSATTQNNNNGFGSRVSPSQRKVSLLS